MRRPLLALLPLFFVLLPTGATAVSEEALALRDKGLAELENERPEEAAAIYRRLIELVPGDALGHGNLAIALLRQQKTAEAIEAIDHAIEKAPGRGDLLAIRGEILQWSGDLVGAVAVLRQAVRAAPENIEILYALYSQATHADDDDAARSALDGLIRLRPENVVVMLERGQLAIRDSDRQAATAVYQRIGELLWQVQPIAERALGMVTAALEGEDVSKARVPAQRLENVLKVSPMFRQSLRELRTGIQGIPIARFDGEPEATTFGTSRALTFTGARIDARPTRGEALVTADFDGDQKADLARIRTDGDANGTLEIRLGANGWQQATEHPAGSADTLLATDLDNDGHLDLLAFGEQGGQAWQGKGDGTVATAPEAWGLAAARATAAAVIDIDIEGDLDLVVARAGERGVDLYRNQLQGALDRVGDKAVPSVTLTAPQAMVASDLDRDGDLDLAIADQARLVWLDNLRQGRLVDRSAEAGLGATGTLGDLISADLDRDGFPELITAGPGLAAWHNDGGRFSPWPLRGTPGPQTRLESVTALDLDNDGRLDLAAAGPGGVHVRLQDAAGRFVAPAIEKAPSAASVILGRDLDADGDLDLVIGGPEGLHRLENQGGNENRWLSLQLRGLAKGDSKNNLFGVGSVVEVKRGQAYQFYEAAGDVLHIGLGDTPQTDVLRVVWTNGVPQNRIDLEGNQRIVEEQLLKGSCPFLYAWDGEAFRFVTDLLWGAPIGLPVAPGIYAGTDADELVRIDGLVAQDGAWELRLTEELWEAAFFDQVRLWVVDHPADVEVASNLRIVPGDGSPEVTRDRVLGTRDLRPVTAAWDGRGTDVTTRVRTRDEVYADGYAVGPYQGVAKAWTFTFDLGEAPGTPIRLHLDGWIFPADASLNLAVAQRTDFPDLPPRLEVQTKDGHWQVLMPSMGHPAGKTKTMVVDTPALPPGAQRLRMVTSKWLHWDRIAWSTAPADQVPVVRARLAPAIADLRHRGYSARVRAAPNAPHGFDYATVRAEGPWLPFPGRYTRYGDVRPLLEARDDLSVILAPGDEMRLRFEAGDLPPVEAGFRRTLFLESVGWDKDADRNTGAGERMEPLPFHAMTGYPYGEDEAFPDSPAHRDYRERWLTREVAPMAPHDARE